jgi:hypothetical protein
MVRREGRVVEALDEYAPVSVPPAGEIVRDAELAAAVSQPPVAELLNRLSRTPGQRGNVADLSGATAALMWMAATPGDSHACKAFSKLSNASLGTRWALNRPQLPPDLKSFYRQLCMITGRKGIKTEFRGHPIEFMYDANFAILRAIRDLRTADGTLVHPRFGQVGIVDGTRLHAPVEQRGPNSPAYVETLRRADLDMVDASTHGRGDHRDTVKGWILASIIDQATGETLVAAVRRVTEYEPRVLFDELLPVLFRYWPDCPLHTLIGDGAYDTEPTVRTLVEDYSIQPIFTRLTPSTAPGPHGVTVINGRPRCRCGPMTYQRREGFLLAEARLREGIPRGQHVDNKDARVRWVCPRGICPPVSLRYDDNPEDHT